MDAISTAIKLLLLLGAQVLTTQGQEQCYSLDSGLDISPGSHDILHQDGLSLGGCCSLCKQTAACQAFVWVKLTGQCYLKSVTSPTVKNDALVSGLRYSYGRAHCFGVDSGLDISPGSHDITHQDGVSLGLCCGLCKQTAACQAFVWVKSNGQCWLKSVTSPTVKNDALISGRA